MVREYGRMSQGHLARTLGCRGQIPRHPPPHFLTVSVDDFETPPAVAVMLTVVVAVTANVVIETVADVDPAGTVTLVLAATLGFELVRVTRSPPAGAGPSRVTFAVDDAPPLTPSGFNVSADSATGLTVSDEVAVVPP